MQRSHQFFALRFAHIGYASKPTSFLTVISICRGDFAWRAREHEGYWDKGTSEYAAVWYRPAISLEARKI